MTKGLELFERPREVMHGSSAWSMKNAVEKAARWLCASTPHYGNCTMFTLIWPKSKMDRDSTTAVGQGVSSDMKKARHTKLLSACPLARPAVNCQ